MSLNFIKKYVLSVLLILLQIPLIAQINNYAYDLVKILKNEARLDTLSYSTMCMPAGPGTFTISKKNFIYVIDTLPKRIVIFDLELNYIKELTSYFTKLKRDIYGAETMKIDDFGNLVLTDRKDGLIKINQEGEEVFFIEKKELPKIIFYNENFFLIEENILFYNNNNKIKSINKEGKIIDELKTKEVIENVKNKSDNKNNRLIEDETITEIAMYAEKNNLLYYDEKILTGDFDKYKKINEKIKQNKNEKVLNSNEIEIDWANIDSTKHLGFDNEKNNYWLASLRSEQLKWIILVFSKEGILIDCFYSICAFAAVAPNGDVYMMDSVNILRDPDYQGVTFYKINRRW